MKKYLFIFALVSVMLFSLTTAFAASEKATIMDDNYDLQSIKTLAIATPNYSPSALNLERKAKLKDAPELITPDMIMQAALNVAKQDEVPFKVLSDIEVNNAILANTGTDINSLNKVEAKKLYKAQINNFADAYVVLTFTNDSRVVMFADIYDAKDNHYIYSYQIIGGGVSDDNMTNYNMFLHKFYRNLDLQIQGK